MTQFPVAELVSQNSEDLFRLGLFQERIVDDNVLLPREAVEEGVGVSAALATINDIQLVQGELEAGRQFIDLGLELAVLEGGELVEQGLDEGGVEGSHQELDAGSKDPGVEDKLRARLLDDLEETGEDRGHEDGREQVGLDHVGDEEAGRLLVEAKLLLEDKGAVDAGRQAEPLLDEHEGEDEDDGVRDLAREARGRVPEQQVAGPGPELGHDVELDEGEVGNLAPEAAGDGEAGFGAAVGLRLVKRFLGDFLGEDGGRLGRLEDTVLAEREEGLEEELADGEAQDQALPWEERAVEELRQALRERRRCMVSWLYIDMIFGVWLISTRGELQNR